MHATHSVGLFGLGRHTYKAIHTPTIYASYSFQDTRQHDIEFYVFTFNVDRPELNR